MRPALNAALAAATLIVVMLFGIWQVAGAFMQPGIRDVPVSADDIRTGRTASALDHKIAELLPWRDRMITAASVLRYVVTRGAGPDVRLGRDGWLFLADELRYHAESSASMESRFSQVAQLNDELKARRVQLVVALVPDKARIYGDDLPEGPAAAYDRSRYDKALEALRSHGIAAIDLRTPLAAAAQTGDVYYRTDTHWNQRGAQIAAGTIGEAVKSLGVSLPPATFREVTGPERERVGDLLRLMGLDHAPDSLRPAPDREAPITTEEAAAPSSGNALFGDTSVPVVLVGTSYSMRANFHGFLEEGLGTRVLNAARDNAGFLQSMNEYLDNDAFRESPPQVIVWELPERFLPMAVTSADRRAGGRRARLQR